MFLRVLLRALFRAAKRSSKKGQIEPQPHPAVIARIKKYMALSMVERYGEDGPP